MRQKVDLSKVPAEWWETDEGRAYARQFQLTDAWAEFLERFAFDAWFTLTYRDPARSSILAIDRACKLLRKVSKKLGTKIGGFIVAEEHRNGTFHVHGLMRLGALSNDTSKDMLREFWAMGLELYGRNSFALVKDSEAVRKYVAKYLTKGPADHRFINIWSDVLPKAVAT